MGNSTSRLHLATQPGVSPLNLREHSWRGLRASAGIGSFRWALAEAESIKAPLSHMASRVLLIHSHNTSTPMLWSLLHLILSDWMINQSINQSSVYQSYLVHKKLLWPVPLPNSDSPTHFFGFHEKISMPVSLPKSTSPVKCKAYLINMPWRYKGGVEV
jgi:hypothetical protein